MEGLNTSSRRKINPASRDGYCPVDSPRTPPKVLSPKPVAFKQESEQLLRLLSNRFTSPLFFTEDSPERISKVSSPNTSKEHEPLMRLISSHAAAAPLLSSSPLHGAPLVGSENELVTEPLFSLLK